MMRRSTGMEQSSVELLTHGIKGLIQMMSNAEELKALNKVPNANVRRHLTKQLEAKKGKASSH